MQTSRTARIVAAAASFVISLSLLAGVADLARLAPVPMAQAGSGVVVA